MQCSRLNDLWSGICVCHDPPIGMSGPVITASTNVRTNSMGQARLYDIVVGWCGHTGVIVTASPNVRVNSLGVARIGDTVTGCCQGSLIQGSPDTRSNG